MKTVTVTTRNQLQELYDKSALTWEGMTTDEGNLREIENWVKEHAVNTDKIVFHIITGKVMNETYGLTGRNAYKDDLTIVALTGINTAPLAVPRFEVGGRWFDDIVDNNQYREEHNNA